MSQMYLFQIMVIFHLHLFEVWVFVDLVVVLCELKLFLTYVVLALKNDIYHCQTISNHLIAVMTFDCVHACFLAFVSTPIVFNQLFLGLFYFKASLHHNLLVLQQPQLTHFRLRLHNASLSILLQSYFLS